MKGKLHKIECRTCGNHSRKTEAQLRQNGPDYCGPCTDLRGVPVKMFCPDPVVHALTPSGRAEALAEALAVDGRKLEREARKVIAGAYQQMACAKCRWPLSKAKSIELIDGYQRATGEGYGGGLLYLTGVAMEDAAYITCNRPGCTHDRFVPVMRSARQKAEAKAVPF